MQKKGKITDWNDDKGFGSIFLIIAFIIFLTLSALTGKIPMIILPIYIVLNIVTYVIYAIDKSASKSGSWRTPESTLHLLALAGGWSGAIIAQKRLRHKSKKQPFRMVFWMTVILNISMLIMMQAPKGSEVLKSIIF